MEETTKQTVQAQAQTEFKIRESGEIHFKGEVVPEILTQVLDESATRHRRFIELEKQRNSENQVIGFVCLIVGFVVLFTITFTAVHGIRVLFQQPQVEAN